MRRTWRDWVILTVAVAVLVAPVGGAAMVPDATWIPGLYDGADGDEVLALVWDQAPALVFNGVAVAGPAPAPACPLPPDSRPADVRTLRRGPRAPPLV